VAGLALGRGGGEGRLAIHEGADERLIESSRLHQVMETDGAPPHRLVHGWQSRYSPELAEEPESRVTWEIEPQEGGYCLLSVTHDQLDGSPKTAESVSGPGWMMVLSGLKTLLETGDVLDPDRA